MYFPMFVNLENKNVVVFGAGKIALRRVNTLINTKCNITVVAPEILCDFYSIKNIKIIKDVYNIKYLKDAFIVLAVTNDNNINNKIYLDCKENNIIVNVASDKNKCDFFFPAILFENNCTIGICGDGENHRLVKNTKNDIQNFFNEEKVKNLHIRVGSRESKLAVEQSNIVIRQLKEKYENINLELITMKTTGDIILNKTLDKIGGKGLFIKELDKALVENKTDVSVHSLKDMPMDIDENLPIIAYLKRENPLDVLILPKGVNTIDINKPIGTSSKRRTFQLKKIYKDYDFKPIRGNILTRLEKLDNGEYSALILAYAGLKRLNLEYRINKVFTSDEVIPGCCQGIIAVQGKKGQDYSYLSFLNDKHTEYLAKCERAFVRQLNGGCSLPISAFAEIENNIIKLKGFYADDNNYIIKEAIGNIEDYENIGISLANKFKEIINEKR